MIRRRRPVREIEFSFDSFLDVVANVVGIILRLIIVAWVAGRSYKGFMPPPPPPVALEDVVELPEPTDPLTPELERQRAELAKAQAQLLDQLKKWGQGREERAAAVRELEATAARRQALESQRAALANAVAAGAKGDQAYALSASDIQARMKRVADQIEALRQAPPQRRSLRYRTPVSSPLQTEEFMFECHGGRVTLLDVGALLEEAKAGLQEQGKLLRNQWEVRDVTPPVDDFRLRYTVERTRGGADALLPGAGPDSGSSFNYGIASWQAEPVRANRGETADAALAPGSTFRLIVDYLEPNQTAVTMWVYPDSFVLYRRLRDYLHERDVVVAGRPMPEGALIGASRDGSASRGQ